MKKSLGNVWLFSFLLIVSVLFACCDLLGNFLPVNPGSTTTTTISEEGSITEYKKIELADLPAIPSGYASPNSSDLESMGLFMESFDSSYQYIHAMLSAVYDETAAISPRSLETGFFLKLRDEGFTIEDPINSADLDVIVHYLDLNTHGYLNSLSKFVMSMNGLYSPDEGEFAADGYTGTSFFMEANSESMQANVLASMLFELEVADTDLVDEGIVNGRLSASYGTDHLYGYSSESYQIYELGRAPYVVQFEIRPFENVPIQDFITAITLLQQLYYSNTPQSDWNTICDLIWGGHGEDYYIRFVAKIGNSYGAEMTGYRLTLDDLDFFAALSGGY